MIFVNFMSKVDFDVKTSLVSEHETSRCDDNIQLLEAMSSVTTHYIVTKFKVI